MPSSHLILCHTLFLLSPIFASIRVFSNKSTLCMRWPEYWSFSFSINAPNEHPGLISFGMDWLDLLEVQGTLKSLLQHHSSKAYNLAIPLLDIYTKETRTERDTCTPMFIEALFTIARTWKQPRCPLANKWIRTLWYTYIMEYYSAIKKNTIESVLMRWMKLEPIIQSEVSQKEKHQHSILMHIYGI